MMFFLLQLDIIKDAASGVAPGESQTYSFLVFILCAAVLGLGYLLIRLYKIKQEEITEVRKDYKELAESSVALMTKVDLHLAGAKSLESDVTEVKRLLTLLHRKIDPDGLA